MTASLEGQLKKIDDIEALLVAQRDKLGLLRRALANKALAAEVVPGDINSGNWCLAAKTRMAEIKATHFGGQFATSNDKAEYDKLASRLKEMEAGR